MGWTFSEVLSRHEVCEASSFGTVVVGVSSREHDLATPLTLCFYPEKGSEPDGPRLLKLHRRGCCAFLVTRSYEAFSKHPLEEMPLLRRGWALQERLLPARTLHFTKTQAV
jgi:hypothetical protein